MNSSNRPHKKYSLIVLAPHPVQYHAPLYREIAKSESINVSVIYCDDMCIRPLYEPEFKTIIKWDIDLLEGYSYVFLKNYSLSPMRGICSRLNPSLFRTIRKSKCDAILIQGYDNLSCWLAFIAAKIYRLKIIWRGEVVMKSEKHNLSAKWFLKKYVLTRLFKSCDAVMYSCTGNKEYLKYYGVPEEKLFPIPCAVDNDFFRKERKKYIGSEYKIRSVLNIDQDDFVVLFCGRFTKRKRPLDLLRAINKVKCKNITALFLGDGIERETLEKFSRINDIKAVFVGFQNQGKISKYYSIADAAIIISDYDPSPKSLNEAMNFELPIIITNVIGTAYDLVKHEVNGYIVSVDDIDSIAMHIDYLNKERAVAKKMGKKSGEYIESWSLKEDVKWIEKAMGYVINS